MLLNCGVGEDSWESLGLQGDPTSPSQRKSVLNMHWKDWCWSWNSNTLATWCEELTHLKRSWWWERLKVGGEGDNRGWDGWMASLTQWTWVWVNSGSWQWTGRPGVLQFMRSQRVGRDQATELNWCRGHSLVIKQLTPAPWCFIIYKTGHRLWLRILSIALEKELKVLDFLQWLNCYYCVLFDCFPFHSAFFSLLWLNLPFATQGRSRRLKFFYRHEAGRGHDGRGLFWEDPITSSLVTEVFAFGLLWWPKDLADYRRKVKREPRVSLPIFCLLCLLRLLVWVSCTVAASSKAGDAFELWCWRRLVRIPWTARRSNESILTEINPEYSLEGLMLKLKLQYFGHVMQRQNSLEKTLMLGKIEGRRRRG